MHAICVNIIINSIVIYIYALAHAHALNINFGTHSRIQLVVIQHWLMWGEMMYDKICN